MARDGACTNTPWYAQAHARVTPVANRRRRVLVCRTCCAHWIARMYHRSARNATRRRFRGSRPGIPCRLLPQNSFEGMTEAEKEAHC